MSELATLPAPTTFERKLLIQEAEDQLGPAFTRTKRAESKHYVQNYTGERLMREEPRRYRLIASMRANGMGLRETCRTAHCNARTVASVERLEAESIATSKAKLTKGYAQLSKMSLERLQEEAPTMPINNLAIVNGIATDKFLNLIGDPGLRVEHTVKHVDGDIFLRMSKLHEGLEKIISAKVVEPLQITEA